MDEDLMALYSRRILALASDIPHLGRLNDADAHAMRRSPQCGSVVTAYVRMQDGRIADFSQEVRACALGQASAALLGACVMGRTKAELQSGRDALFALLKNGTSTVESPFDGIEVLTPAKEFPNRHASIMLAWDATLDAIANTET